MRDIFCEHSQSSISDTRGWRFGHARLMQNHTRPMTMNHRFAGSAIALSVCTVFLLTSAGCVAGNSTRIESPTTGQELIDLKAALDQGAITQAEYEGQKAKLLGTGRTEVMEVTIREKQAD